MSGEGVLALRDSIPHRVDIGPERLADTGRLDSRAAGPAPRRVALGPEWVATYAGAARVGLTSERDCPHLAALARWRGCKSAAANGTNKKRHDGRSATSLTA